MRILVLQGPNLNLIGIKSSKIGEKITLNKVNKHIRAYVRKLDIDLKIIQTHNEAKAVSYLHRNRNNFDGMILIPGVWQKTAYILKETS